MTAESQAADAGVRLSRTGSLHHKGEAAGRKRFGAWPPRSLADRRRFLPLPKPRRAL
jgi:hypothetical protein